MPNDHVHGLAASYPDIFLWACSVHPYRADACDELERCHRRGARICKWLPNSMIIDPDDARCDDFYAACARLGMALLCHTGSETSVDFLGSRVDNELGNPLRLRRALCAGVRVIAAHCASEGEARDDAGVLRPCHELLFGMMARPEWEQLLFADISALCSACSARTKRCTQSRCVPPMASSASLHERHLPPPPSPPPASWPPSLSRDCRGQSSGGCMCWWSYWPSPSSSRDSFMGATIRCPRSAAASLGRGHNRWHFGTVAPLGRSL